MKIIKLLVLAIALVAALAACSKSSTTASPTAASPTPAALTPADGVKAMKDTLVQLQKDVDAGDATKVKAAPDKLEESWSKFEDTVKKNQPDVYEKVEEPLGAIKTGATQPTLDKVTLKDQIKQLNDALDQIK
jgi:hypothetical protein